jgi:hypothetical protein
MIKKLILMTVASVFTFSCTKEDDSNFDPDYVGHYKLITFEVDQEVDLNNDNNSNKNLKIELKEYFSKSTYDLEILLRKEDPKNAIRLKLPDWNLDSHTSEIQETAHEFYSVTLISFYSLNNGFEFIPKKWGDNEEIIEGSLDEDSNTISLLIAKKYFNFNSREWEKLQISAKYVKINL